MMKYYEDEETRVVAREGLWCYEGVVLPGDKVVLGRWWSPDDGVGEGQYSGPFLLWNVD